VRYDEGMTADTEKGKEQVRAASRARSRAYQILSNRHREEFNLIYEEEALKEGVLAPSARRRMLRGTQ